MIDDLGLDDLLRRADPVDVAALPAGTSPAAQLLLERRVLERRRRRPVVLVAVAAAALVAATGAGWLLTSRPASQALDQGCFRTAGYSGDGTALPPTSDPVAACRSAWSTQFHTTPPAVLTPCVNAGGGVYVFPGADACARAGLAPWNGRLTDLAAREAAFARDVRIAPGACPTEAEGVATARRELAAHGFAGWTVDASLWRTAPISPGRSCAVVGLSTGQRQAVVLRVTPRADGTIGEG